MEQEQMMRQKEETKKTKKIICKNRAPFTDSLSERNNTQIDNAKDLDDVMPIFNSILI